MSAIFAILKAKLRITLHTIASVRSESKLKVSVVSVSAVLLWIGAFLLFHEGFHALKEFGEDLMGDTSLTFGIGEIVMARLLSVFALALFVMLIFSNVLIAFSTLYKSHEVQFLVQSPMPFWAYFLARFAECIWFSSWASAYLGSPLILAYGLVSGDPVRLFAAAILYYLPFVTIPAAIGAIVAMALVRVFPRLRTGAIIGMGFVVVVLLFTYVHYRVTAERLAQDNIVGALFEAASQTQTPYLPSYWASRGVLMAGAGIGGSALYYWLLLVSNALFLTWLAAGVAQKFFYSGWSYLAGQDRTLLRPVDRGVFAWAGRAIRFVANPYRVLVLKDLRLFWRDPAQWSQFVIFFGLMAIYIANLRPDAIQRESDMWRTWIICLNIAACSLILATLTSRFVFPLVSLEGRRFWILGLAPITLRQLIWQKFWLSVITTSMFTVGLIILSCVKLQVDGLSFVLSVYLIVLTNFALTGLAIGLGSLYPNFQEDNPARIVSGMGGTLNFLLSIGYLVVVVGLQTLILQARVMGSFSGTGVYYGALVATLAFITGVSLVCWLAPIRLGLRNLRALEF